MSLYLEIIPSQSKVLKTNTPHTYTCRYVLISLKSFILVQLNGGSQETGDDEVV